MAPGDVYASLNDADPGQIDFELSPIVTFYKKKKKKTKQNTSEERNKIHTG